MGMGTYLILGEERIADTSDQHKCDQHGDEEAISRSHDGGDPAFLCWLPRKEGMGWEGEWRLQFSLKA